MPLRLHSLMVVPPVSAYQMVSGLLSASPSAAVWQMVSGLLMAVLSASMWWLVPNSLTAVVLVPTDCTLVVPTDCTLVPTDCMLLTVSLSREYLAFCFQTPAFLYPARTD